MESYKKVKIIQDEAQGHPYRANRRQSTKIVIRGPNLQKKEGGGVSGESQAAEILGKRGLPAREFGLFPPTGKKTCPALTPGRNRIPPGGK